ncbi:MAG: hypothetical protein AAGB19_02175 [Cyanobacteria bacterium P01_F01_bin.3]
MVSALSAIAKLLLEENLMKALMKLTWQLLTTDILRAVRLFATGGVVAFALFHLIPA